MEKRTEHGMETEFGRGPRRIMHCKGPNDYQDHVEVYLRNIIHNMYSPLACTSASCPYDAPWFDPYYTL